MNNSVQHLKVDQTCLDIDAHRTYFISNFNIPEHYLDNIRPVLERVFVFLQRDYLGVPLVRYQLTASYELIHKQTGALRHWSGSFMPKDQNLSSIDTFHILGPNFVNRLEPLCDRFSIIEKLLLNGVESDWQIHTLTSIVITVQAIVAQEFHTLTLRNLKTRRNGRTRAHVTFPLP